MSRGRLTQQVLRSEPGHAGEALVHPFDATIQVGDEDAVGHLTRDEGQPSHGLLVLPPHRWIASRPRSAGRSSRSAATGTRHRSPEAAGLVGQSDHADHRAAMEHRQPEVALQGGMPTRERAAARVVRRVVRQQCLATRERAAEERVGVVELQTFVLGLLVRRLRVSSFQAMSVTAWVLR